MLLVDSPKENEKDSHEEVSNCGNKESNEQNQEVSSSQVFDNEEKKNNITGGCSEEKENISQNQPFFNLEILSDLEISDDDDKQSIIVCITLFLKIVKFLI